MTQSWSTPYVSFGTTGAAGALDFLGVKGSGRMTPRHFMDLCAHKGDMMTVASDAERIVVAIDPSWVEEASYIVNNLLCAVLQADRSKIVLQPSRSSHDGVVSVYFYDQAQAAPKVSKPIKSKPHKSHHHGHPKHSGHGHSVHIF